MSSLAFLVTELQSLASETRRKHPEIREAAEKSLAILRSSPDQAVTTLASDGPQSEDLLKPVFMGCATKNAKVVAISLGSLQRLIALRAVPQSAVPLILNTMSDAMSQGVDIQLRILQTLVSLVPNFQGVRGDLLGDALLLCFKLQESRIAVVSSTAAATMRQLVMFVVDKMVAEDRQHESTSELSEMYLPDGSTVTLGPAAKDVHAVFEDLCLLANGEKPHFLKLEFLHKTFALELVESVLTNYHELFRKNASLLLLLRHHLCPLLLKALSDRPHFPLMLRCTRVVFLLLKQFAKELTTETEVFLMLLIKLIAEDENGSGEHGHAHASQKPAWVRVLAMEIMRGLCNDPDLMRYVYEKYDSQDASSHVFGSLVSALNRLMTERPALLGVGTQMGGVGVHSDSEGLGAGVGAMAGRVASGVAGMMGAGNTGSSPGLSVAGSAMKLQCIDQLDKAEVPPIPESYPYLLAVQCLVSLSDGLFSSVAPLYTTIVGRTSRAPAALDLSTLPQGEPSTKQLKTSSAMLEAGWPALLAALSFVLSTNLSDDLFVDALGAYQALTNTAGILGLTTPRDAFFTSLAKYAVPTRVVSSLDSYMPHTDVPPSTPRAAAAALSENLGLGTPPQSPPGLSERNMACLKAFLASVMFLAGTMGTSWFQVLEVLQNADYVFTGKGMGQSSSSKRIFSPTNNTTGSQSRNASSSTLAGAIGGGQSPGPTRHPLLSDLDPETMQAAIQRLFDASKNLEDSAFSDFVGALCRLSAEMVGMQTGGEVVNAEPGESVEDVGLSPRDPAHRRRVSGIHIPRTLRSGDFGITKLGGIAMLNIHRLIYRSPEVAWNTTTSHLLSIIHLSFAPQPIRVQAARVLDEILLIVPRNLTSAGELQGQVQRRVLDVLAQQVVSQPSGFNSNTATNVELRRMGLETLHQILQASGHTFVVGWETVFQMLESVCRPAPPVRSGSTDSVALLSSPPSPKIGRNKPIPLGLGNPSEKSYTALVKIAFQSLTLVCDSVSSLSPEHLRLCISTLGQFGKQADTNIALTAAASLLWSVSDAIQSKRKNENDEPEYSELWMFLLLEVLGLCTDTRPEVRDGAIQTLFRTMQLYGSTLSEDTWDKCIWKVTFPLLDSLTLEIRQYSIPSAQDINAEQAWAESKILALHSIGSIFNDFLVSKIMHLASFPKAWDVFVGLIQQSVLLDNRSLSAPALRCLEKATKASCNAEGNLKDPVSDMLERIWEAIDAIGAAILKRRNAHSPLSPTVEASSYQPFTQESLVAFVDVIQSTRNTSRTLSGKEWDLDRLTRLMAILKGVLTYPESPDYRPDIDALPPVQAVVIDTVVNIDLSAPGSASLVMQDLSEYATLPFLAAFDIQPQPKSQTPQTPQKRITYIALSKKMMPMLVDLYLRFKESLEIYNDGTLESVLSAYSIPVKLKYDCPAPSKFGKDLPLWKTATTCFLRVVRESTRQVHSLGSEIPDDRIEGIWRQMLDVFRGGILADCSTVDTLPLDVQEVEENFDLALIASLEFDVVPYVGDSRVPDSVVSQLSRILHQGSRVYHDEDLQSEAEALADSSSNGRNASGRSRSIQEVDVKNKYEYGNTNFGSPVPRERFSYWCFDLLFVICSCTEDTTPQASRRRLAALSVSSLLNRCHATLVGYVADEALRGNLPFPRAREEELLYVLRKLLSLRLWSGSLWAALSDDPSKYCAEQPALDHDTTHTPSDLIADAVKRSSFAHLFHFYPVLCEIASIPRRTPSVWISSSVVLSNNPSKKATSTPSANDTASVNGYTTSTAEEQDSRVLARDCLKELGKEMGVSQ
ncbi:hypothetical protein BDQ12DRAFT_735649 [Crucibulum laeve]|uniref:Protein MON2 homolog n=1 Tax=Crucibulum laeve TaxID=68775 RepID=A0A5C3M2H9_9AGAR|nr:hypothetical protein BDQ12DRAFT_735649 [Crucibulum laeve]